jgi:hypothetical protein
MLSSLRKRRPVQIVFRVADDLGTSTLLDGSAFTVTNPGGITSGLPVIRPGSSFRP